MLEQSIRLIILWLNLQEGRMRRVVCSDWLFQKGKMGPSLGIFYVVPVRKRSLFGLIIKYSLTEFVRSRLQDISIILFCLFH